MKQTLAGCRGTFSLNLRAGQVPTLQFDFVGKYADPADAVMTTAPSYTAWKDPVLADPAGTPTTEIFGEGVGLRELSIDYGAEVAWENLIGGTPGARLRDRQTRGNLSVSAPKVAHAGPGQEGGRTAIPARSRSPTAAPPPAPSSRSPRPNWNSPPRPTQDADGI